MSADLTADAFGADARPLLGYMPTVPAIVRRAADCYGANDFVVLPDRRVSFAEAEAASKCLAKQLLAEGVTKGARVGIHLTTGPEWALAFLAAARIGALAMPFSTLYRPDELRTAMRIGDVSVLISSSQMLGKDHHVFLEETVPGLTKCTASRIRIPDAPYLRSIMLFGQSARDWATPIALTTHESERTFDGFDDGFIEAVEKEVTPADWLVAVFTSGTTAEPKAVLHSHGAAIRKTSREGDGSLNAQYGGRVLSLMPAFWVGGLQELLSALQSGAAVVTLERLDARQAIDLGRRERVTSVMGNAQAMRSLLGATDLTDMIPTVRSLPARPWAGGPSSRGDQSVAIGMTETFGPWNNVPGIECRIVDPETGDECSDRDVGEFQVRGYALAQGLYKREREDTFTRDGFYPTGDLGYVEDGRYYFASRLKDLIKTKGANVAPAEVEAVLNSVDSVQMSFVVGLPHDVFGEAVVAAVVPRDGQLVDTAAVLAECRRVLSSYKVPIAIETLAREDIPYLSSSKPDRLGIKSLLQTRHQLR